MREGSGFGQAQILFLWPYWIERAISAQRVVSQVVDVIGGGFEAFGHSRGDRWMLADVGRCDQSSAALVVRLGILT
jgi:hypothetical protein